MRLRYFCLLIVPILTLHAYAYTALGTAGSFAVLGGSTVTNTGATIVRGNLGVSPGSAVTGFPPGTVFGTIHAANAVAAQAQADNNTAFNSLAAMPFATNLTGQNLGGLTLFSGVYHFDSSAQLTGALILDAQGNDNAFWVFQIGSTLTTASASNVHIINLGSNPNNGLFWQVGSSATLGTNTAFEGNILALTSITLNTGATIDCGRALAQNGAVTMDTNTISIGCVGTGLEGSDGLSGSLSADNSPVPEPASIALLGPGLFSLFGMVRRRIRK